MSKQTQDYSFFHVRDAAITTNSYVAGEVIGLDTTAVNFSEGGVHLKNQLELYIAITLGSLTDVLIKIEFSDDNSTYYQEAFSSITAGLDTVSLAEHKFSASGNFRLALPIKDRYIKVSVKGEGTVTSSSVSIKTPIGIA